MKIIYVIFGGYSGKIDSLFEWGHFGIWIITGIMVRITWFGSEHVSKKEKKRSVDLNCPLWTWNLRLLNEGFDIRIWLYKF